MVACPSKGPDLNRSKARSVPCEAQSDQLQDRAGMKGNPGIVKLLLPPRQSRGNSLRIRTIQITFRGLGGMPPLGTRKSQHRLLRGPDDCRAACEAYKRYAKRATTRAL
jgi:hypothetical protein